MPKSDMMYKCRLSVEVICDERKRTSDWAVVKTQFSSMHTHSKPKVWLAEGVNYTNAESRGTAGGSVLRNTGCSPREPGSTSPHTRPPVPSSASTGTMHKRLTRMLAVQTLIDSKQKLFFKVIKGVLTGE